MLSVALLMLLFLRVLSKAYWQRQLLAMGKDDHLWVIDIPGVGDKSLYLLMEQRKTRATTDVKCDGQVDLSLEQQLWRREVISESRALQWCQRHGGCLSGDFRLATPSLAVESLPILDKDKIDGTGVHPRSLMLRDIQLSKNKRAIPIAVSAARDGVELALCLKCFAIGLPQLQLHLHKLVEASTGSSRRPTPDAQRDYYGGYFGVQRHGKTSTQELLLMDQAIYGSQNEGQTV
ncbi:hypothetical protein SELMODRAFT_437929 [Selaginella moellendorffii]|uniref:Uncharacterized protein n=1 Tax=Selaginella moellendorffii TaxID=88036 RepID=D8QS33_SELML|nr:hypothetical protein SELMODRAFT_437929 [Selaginella moellendorffii]